MAAIRSAFAIGGTVLEPSLLAPLAAALYYSPADLRQRALTTLRITPSTLLLILRLLVAYVATRRANRLLSSWAANNGRMSGQPGWNWPNEIAVVTGGCSGIGKAVAEGLAAKGVRVAVLDVQDAPAELAAMDRITVFRCDVTSASAVAETGAAIRSTLGRPSILVNNAGMGTARRILDTDQEALTKIFRVNLLSHWVTVQEFLPAMLERNKGHVVTVASMASFITPAMITDYCATKSGALSFHEGLTQEIKHVYKAPSVVTSVVHPNWVMTPMIAQDSAHIASGHGKLLTVDQVAGPILKQIFSRRGGQVIIPEGFSGLAGIRGWPTWSSVGLRDRVTKTLARRP